MMLFQKPISTLDEIENSKWMEEGSVSEEEKE